MNLIQLKVKEGYISAFSVQDMSAIKYFKEKKNGKVYVGQKELDDGKERKC